MMARNHEQSLGGNAATLLQGAIDGDPTSFDGLFRRFGPEAWRYAAGVSGVDPTARFAVADGFANSVVAARDGGITHPGGFRRSLLHATRARVAERDDVDAPGHAASTETLAASFASLPEMHRSVLWLEHVHLLRANRIAEVVEVPPTEVMDLSRRAHHGIAAHHLSAVAAELDNDCADTLRMWTRSLARRLPLRERAAVRSHVASCADCMVALAPVNDLDTYLSPLAAPLPEDLLDETRAAWLAAITPPTSTGLSPLVEKVLAATSATAAVVAIVGAAYWRGDSPSQTVAVAPVLHQVGAPVPALEGPDITRIEIPGADESTSPAKAALEGGSTTATNPNGAPSSDDSGSTGGDTQGLADSEATVNPAAGDPVEEAAPSGSADTADEPAPAPEADPQPAPAPEESKPLLTVSLPLGSKSVNVNVGGGDLIETGPNASSLAGGSLIDGLTDAVGGLLGG